MRLIDADALEREGWSLCRTFEKDKTTMVYEVKKPYDFPTIEERKRSTWIDYTEDGYVECPFCHSATNCDGNKADLHFCFWCGADMKGEEE